MNFADVSSNIFWNFNLSVEFKFTDDTISSFSHVLGTFPQQAKERNMPKITFEDTIDNISLENLESLLILSANRVSINLWKVDIKKIFLASNFHELLTTNDPNTLNPAVKNFFSCLLLKKVYQLVDFLLDQNPSLMKFNIQSPSQKD